MTYQYNAKLVRVVDGDTVWLEIDLGFRTKITLDFRLAGIDTPEVVGPTRTAGINAKAELERLLGLGPISVQTFKPDKYGRWLARIFVQSTSGPEICVNDALLSGGFSVPYMTKS